MNTKVSTIQRGEGRHGVGNGLDRGSVEVVVDDIDRMPVCDVLTFQVLLLLKATPRWKATGNIQ